LLCEKAAAPLLSSEAAEAISATQPLALINALPPKGDQIISGVPCAGETPTRAGARSGPQTPNCRLRLCPNLGERSGDNQCEQFIGDVQD